MRTNTVDVLLDRCSDLQGQRDRAVVQRAGYEGHLWHAETLLKQFVRLVPRLIAVEPADIVARDSLLEQAEEFINEPRHHPNSTLLDGAAGPSGPSEGAVEQGGKTLADEVREGLHEEPHP